MIIQKYLWTYYPKLFFECKNKRELIKYFFKKMVNNKAEFSKDVIVKSNGIYYNCGRLMDNCRVACSSFEPEIVEEIKKVRFGIFIDVGASIGKFGLIKAEQVWDEGVVYFIEANENSCNLIKKSIELNELGGLRYRLKTSRKGVEVLNIVLSDKKKMINFYQRDYYPSSSGTINIPDSKIIKRETDTLDNLFGDVTSFNGDVTSFNGDVTSFNGDVTSFKDINLIKVDVEGEDLNVLKGGINIIKLHKPKIIFEAWDEKELDEMKEFLEPLGYKINNIGEGMNYVADHKDAIEVNLDINYKEYE